MSEVKKRVFLKEVGGLSSPWDRKINELVLEIPELLKKFNPREEPGLYFYRRTIDLRRSKNLDELFDDPSDRFIELVYTTLVAWNMNTRRAQMKYFDEFKASILSNRERFTRLASSKLEMLSSVKGIEVKVLYEIFSNLHLMESKGRLVSNSKVMHFILPDLVMPMDRQNTLKFFFKNTNESNGHFLRLFEFSHEIAKKIDLTQYLDDKWNLSVPKVIDNAILSKMEKT